MTGTWLHRPHGRSHGRGAGVPRAGWIRTGAVAGAAGPAAFTLAWLVSAFRQRGLSFATPQISGLAAENARDPWLMISGFLLLGAGGVSFGAALSAALGGTRQAGPGPVVIQAAGVLAMAAGLLRRDHVLLTSGPESWHNRAHDIVSAAAYVLLVAAPVLLARRLRAEREWGVPIRPLVAAAVVSAALLIAFYAAPHDSWDATLQRIAVTLPLAAIAAVAVRLAQVPGALAAASPGDRDARRHTHPGGSGQPE